ncbi:MAG: M42 family peptidase, partial [Thermotogae bacterium]|nr:M42 family peptidase [Thermotogota bacterium]
QREAVPGRSGTDTDLIQLVRDGVKTMLISIPLRYMHTPTEVLSLKDLNLTVRLVTEFLMRKG